MSTIPRFIHDHLERQAAQIENEERLCAQVMAIPVSEEELAEIQFNLDAYVTALFDVAEGAGPRTEA